MPDLLSGESRLYPILGDPVKYAKSPELLTKSFAARGHNAVCIPMEVSESAFDVVMMALAVTPNVDGILTTMPHKFTAKAYCSTLSEASRLFSAVSVIRRNADGTWHGDSQDGPSFVKAQIDHGANVRGARALLIGAGGAGSSIALELLNCDVGEIVVYDLDHERVNTLIETLGDKARGRMRYGPPDPRGFDMLCNATHLGMNDDDPLPIDPALLDSSIFVGDVIAGHGITGLIQAARDAGCKTATGDQMVEAVQDMMVDYMLGL